MKDLTIGQENYGITPSFGPNAYNGEHLVPHPSLKAPYGNDFAMRSFGPLSDAPYIPPDPEKKIPGYKGWWDKGKPFKYNDEKDRDLMVDEESTAWVIDFLQKDYENPFFLTVGFMRPHRPQIVPEKYFEMYPLDNIQLPPYLDNDLNDVPEILWKDIGDTEKNKGYKDFKDLMKAYPDKQGWKLWLQSYLACMSFVDDQLGGVLEARI